MEQRHHEQGEVIKCQRSFSGTMNEMTHEACKKEIDYKSAVSYAKTGCGGLDFLTMFSRLSRTYGLPRV